MFTGPSTCSLFPSPTALGLFISLEGWVKRLSTYTRGTTQGCGLDPGQHLSGAPSRLAQQYVGTLSHAACCTSEGSVCLSTCPWRLSCMEDPVLTPCGCGHLSPPSPSLIQTPSASWLLVILTTESKQGPLVDRARGHKWKRVPFLQFGECT